MRYLTLVILLGTLQSSYSQDVRFQFYRVSKCDDVERLDSGYYYLTNLATGFDTTYQNINGTVILPDTGKYQIHLYEEPDTELEPVHLKEVGLFQYKYYEPKIVLWYYGMHGHGQRVYKECGIPIDGFKEDFYSNGKIRIRGNFVKGLPKDSLVTFYENGTPERRLTFLKNEIKIEEFDILSNRIKISYNSNKSYFLTVYKSTTYYANGKIKKEESSNDNLILIKSFYPNGILETRQTKKDRIEYYESGKIRNSYTWKRKRNKVIQGEYKYTITMLSYDSSGQICEKIVFEEWGSYRPQPNFEITESDWIVNWVTYKQNKETIVIKDIDPKAYFKPNH